MNKKKKIIIISILIGIILVTSIGIEIFFLIQDQNIESINQTETKKQKNLSKQIISTEDYDSSTINQYF